MRVTQDGGGSRVPVLPGRRYCFDGRDELVEKQSAMPWGAPAAFRFRAGLLFWSRCFSVGLWLVAVLYHENCLTGETPRPVMAALMWSM